MFSVCNMYLDHLKLCVVCMNGRSYVYCSECYDVSNESDEPSTQVHEAIKQSKNKTHRVLTNSTSGA